MSFPHRTHPNRRLLAAVGVFVLLAIAASWTPMASGVGAIGADASGSPSPSDATITASSLASTAATMEASLLTSLNTDRTAHGLAPLRVDVRLTALAGDRAAWMAGRGTMSHDSADGTVGQAFTTRSIAFYMAGEDIGWTTAAWGQKAAAFLYKLWRASPTHWALMMSNNFNYVGIGVAYRASAKATYGSIMFMEGPDRTAPLARILTRTRTGRTLRFTWTGHDALLQTHTAGIRDYSVQYRIDDGTWRQIRTRYTACSLTLRNRPAGHWYWIRVQARDRRGNLSAWRTVRIRVP